mmetsp:Transcript_8649/g.13750  ORF Transcript_8649/g.13750 Transcript_8649/m.13750 type:complete len:266 (-) Transcript_8649:21-818(-)
MAITSVALLSLRRSAGTRSARSTLDPLHLPISMTRSKDSRRPSATCGRKARQLCMVYADTSFKGHLVAKESAMRIIFTISDYCIGALRKARSCGGSIGATLLVHWVGFIPLSWSRSIPRRCMMICGPTSSMSLVTATACSPRHARAGRYFAPQYEQRPPLCDPGSQAVRPGALRTPWRGGREWPALGLAEFQWPPSVRSGHAREGARVEEPCAPPCARQARPVVRTGSRREKTCASSLYAAQRILQHLRRQVPNLLWPPLYSARG